MFNTIMVILLESACVLNYDTTVECNTQEYNHICSNCWLCASNIHHFSDNSSHSVPHKSVQKVCLMLQFLEVAWSAHVCGIISRRVQG